ncbi:MAG TPA: 50S ribosomal protein L10 [Thermoplasmata archaeon]|nr:50S ribosomal protein L10 [Thermoplasmata archaeon]HYB77050.1 50S ribosomal protein L10 [Thermoplasmata archaeon]
MPGRGSVPSEKVARVDALAASLVSKPMVALVGIRGVPASALQSMRRELRRREHPITVATNSTIRHALERAMKERPAFRPLLDQVEDPTAVLSATGNPFSLYQEFLRTRSPTPARGGEVAPADIVVPAGTTSFKPGPIVGELQHAGFPAAIEKGKVIIKKDTTIVKAGGTISREVAGLLTRLEIFPLEVGLTLRAVVDGSTYYPPDVLSVDLESRRADLAHEAARALALAVEIGYPTPESLPRLVSRAHRRALGVALATQYLTKETIEPLFAQAMREAAAVGRLMGH